jgi:hypothetical protein
LQLRDDLASAALRLTQIMAPGAEDARIPSEIAALERGIDLAVYAMYGLRENEIPIVEAEAETFA